ncbi:MAG: ATP-binding cassette domain-containing protein [Ilumatobacteraceae bacterium]
MLRVEGLSKQFGDTRALDDVSLTVPSGRIVGFLGPNGAGKTTTMRSIMGLVSFDRGRITWDDEPITSATRRLFGYMPAERGMYPKMRVGEQLEYFARLAGRSAGDARSAADVWLDRMGLASRRDDEVQALSSGNQQRLQLSIALVHEPRLVILDEPFSGLDPIAVESMKRMLVEQVELGVTILLSSHQLDLVSDVCRDVVIVSGGRVVLDGDVGLIRQSSPSREAMGVLSTGDVDAVVLRDGWEVLAASESTIRLRVPAATDANDVFEALRSVGPVIEFSFGPPELSDVFIESVTAA